MTKEMHEQWKETLKYIQLLKNMRKYIDEKVSILTNNQTQTSLIGFPVISGK